MKHAKRNRTLGRTRRGRTALLRGLAVSLIKEGQITTTTAKAKELRPYVERLITTSRNDTVAARRVVASRLGEPSQDIVQKLFTEVAPRYYERSGGYTRIVKMGTTSPGRSEAVIELV
jgi:large subunit ribosomal protein L17